MLLVDESRMGVPELLPLFRSPTDDVYRNVRYKLIMAYMMGRTEVKPVLDSLPEIYHLYKDFDFYSALFGHRRAVRLLLKRLSVVVPSRADEVSMLLELYRMDDEYLEPLVDALIRLKVEVAGFAPDNLMKLFDETIASADKSKKTSFIRKVQVLLSYVRMLREVGPEHVSRAVDVLLNRMVSSAPTMLPPLKAPSETDLLSVLRSVALTNIAGRAVSKADFMSHFETPEQAATVLRRLTSRAKPMMLYDKQLGGFVVTPIGLRELEKNDLLKPRERRRLIAFMRTSSLIMKLVDKGILPPEEEEEVEEGVPEEAEGSGEV